MKRFKIWPGVTTLRIEPDVLEYIASHRQLSAESTEAGGQLFGVFNAEFMICDVVTGPYHEDSRTRHSFSPKNGVEQTEIDAQFESGKHYFGDWHTHPEEFPKPSRLDKRDLNRIARKAKRQLSGFVMIIAGTSGNRDGLSISFSSGCHTKIVPYEMDAVAGSTKTSE